MRKIMPLALLGLLAFYLGGCQVSNGPITGLEMGPYTTYSSPTTAHVLWITEPGSKVDSTITVDQGATATIALKPMPGREDMLHVATVTGLKPGLFYRYNILFSRKNVAVGEAPGEFQSAFAPGSTEPFRFVVYGDTRSFPVRHHAVASAIDREGQISFVMQSGDFCANGNVWRLWKKEYFDPAKEMLSHTTLWPAMGNHEQNGLMAKAIFDLPRSYYSFDYGNIHWCVIDSELAEAPGQLKSRKADPTMLKWLAQDLAASHATWKFVSYHRPTFDAITHRTTWGQSDMLPVMEKGGVDIVFAGHTHNYQRFVPIGEPGTKPTLFIVSAGGGAPNYPVNPSPIIAKAYSGIHYCVVSIDGNKLDMTVKYPDGTAFDHLSLVKTDGMFQKEVMDQAVSTTYARNAAFLLTGIYARSNIPPAPGAPFALHISPEQFPEGAIVEISSAAPAPPEPDELPHGSWTIKPVTITGWTGQAGVDESAGVLDFHITVEPAEMGGQANIAAAEDSLETNGPRKDIPIPAAGDGATARWYAINPDDLDSFKDGFITTDLDEETYVLCFDDPERSLTHTPEKHWTVTAGNPSADSNGNIGLPFTLDYAGAGYMASLTTANKGRNMAVLLDNHPMCAPVIRATIRRNARITFGRNVAHGDASKQTADALKQTADLLKQAANMKKLVDGHRELHPFTVMAYPPADMQVTMSGFTPPIRVSLKVTYQGKTFSTDSAGVFFYSTDLKAWQLLRAAETGEPLPAAKTAAAKTPRKK